VKEFAYGIAGSFIELHVNVNVEDVFSRDVDGKDE
jgi:hypothetical protein